MNRLLKLGREDRDSGVGVSFISEDEESFEEQPNDRGRRSSVRHSNIFKDERRESRRRSELAAEVKMAKAEVGLHMYSGFPIGTKYEDGMVERYTAETWCGRLEMVAGSAGWRDAAKAANAALALQPGTPAERWYQVVKDLPEIRTWAGFKEKLLEEFMPEESVLEKIALLNSMTQERGETVADFRNKLTGKMERFNRGLNPLWQGSYYTTKEAVAAGEDPVLKKHRERTVADIIDYLSRLMFISGLEKEIQLDVAKSTEAKTLEEMVAVAKRSEAALAAVRGPRTGKEKKAIHALEKEETSSGVREQIAALIAEELEARAKSGGGGDKGKKKKSEKKDKSKVGCYYCLEYGHFAGQCEIRKKDRDEDIWRPTVKDRKMTRAEYYSLSDDEKRKGKEMWQAKVKSAEKKTGGVAGLSRRAEANRQGENKTSPFWMDYGEEN